MASAHAARCRWEPRHLACCYGFGTDPDTDCAFQLYRSREAAEAFVASPACLAYAESRDVLAQDAGVTILAPRWTKGMGEAP